MIRAVRTILIDAASFDRIPDVSINDSATTIDGMIVRKDPDLHSGEIVALGEYEYPLLGYFCPDLNKWLWGKVARRAYKKRHKGEKTK